MFVRERQLWKLIADDLQVSLSQGNYSSWIKPTELVLLQPVGDQHQIAEIACPSSFHQQILESRYYAQIKEAFDRITKKATELRFSVNHQLRNTKDLGGPLFSFASQPQVDEFQLAQHRAGLNEEHTFDSFAVSSSNEMAHAAALAVSQNFGGAYNPLFLYGGVGVGKTHLMQAIGNNGLKHDPKISIAYCSGEEFTNEIIDAIQQKKTREFRNRYRKAKVILIDDIQFIAGKTTVQEEFFHTFNAVTKIGGQIVMTSDRPPEAISNLEDRLRSRFEGGLLIDIGAPNFELRTAILLIKANQRGVQLPMQVAQAVAANIESTRKLEGFLVRLITETKARRQPFSVEMVQSILGKRLDAPATPLVKAVRPQEVVEEVSRYFNLPPKEVCGPRRSRSVLIPRQVAMYLLRVDLELPLIEIGRFFGGRDHTTVMHAVEKISGNLSGSDSLRLDVANLRKSLRA